MEILKGWAPGHVLNVDNILLGTLGVALCHLAVVPSARTLALRLRHLATGRNYEPATTLTQGRP